MEWASKIENQVAKQGKLRTIAATQWVAEGKGGANPQAPGRTPQQKCPFCTKANHSLNQCWLLRDTLNLPRLSVQTILQDLHALKPEMARAEEQRSRGQKSKNVSDGDPYSALQVALAALAAKDEDSL